MMLAQENLTEYSLLARCPPVQPLPLVLARLMVNTPLGKTERHNLLSRIFCTLCVADKLRCVEELRLCRLAKRGEIEATVQ